MKIISRYLLKEHVGPFFFSLTALTSIMLLQYIARRFGDLVGKGLSWWVITKFFLLSIPFTVAMTLPMAVLVAVLYAFSRLAAENEITALKAGGVSMKTLMVPALGAGTAMAFVMLLFNDQVLPRANHELAILQADIFNTKPTFALRPQVINPIKEGQLYLRADHLDEGSSRMRGVVIYDVSDPTRRRTIYADSGLIAAAPNHSDLVMTLFHGEIQTVETQRPDQLERLFYRRLQQMVPGVMKAFQQSGTDSAQKSDREMSVCEMQAELARYSAALQRTHNDMLRVQWEEKKSAGVKVAPLALDSIRPTYGIGGLYCTITDRLQKLLHVKEAHAAELPEGLAAVRAWQDTVRATLTPRPMAPDTARATHGLARLANDTTRLKRDTTVKLDSTGSTYRGLLPRTAIPDSVRPSSASAATNEMQMSEARIQLEDSRYYVSRYSIEIHKKFALATACIVFVLIGAPIALRFPRGGVGLVIGVSLLIFSIYYVALIAGESLANKGLVSPFWAMWAANVIFFLISLLLLARMGREASTSRGGDFSEAMLRLRARFGRLFGRRATEEYA